MSLDIDEETGGSKEERKEQEEWHNRDLKKPLLQKMMGDDYKKFFNE